MTDELKLTPEQREEVEKIFDTLKKRPPKPQPDLRDHYKVGGTLTIRSPQRDDHLLIRTVGRSAMNVEVKEKGRSLVQGSELQVNDLRLRVVRSKKRSAALELVQ